MKDVKIRTEKEHFYWLDLLRFVAAFLVALNHSRNDFFVMYGDLPADQQGTLTSIFYFIARLGHESVVIFFVLSGFLVGGIGLERLASNNFKYRSYVIDRISRIMTPLFGAVVLFFITCRLTNEPFDWLTAIGNLLSLQDIFCKCLVSPFWSLAFEVWFYIMLFAVALMYYNRGTQNHNFYIKACGYILFFICCCVFTKLEPVYLLIWVMGALAYKTRPLNMNKWVFIISIVGVIVFTLLYELSVDSVSLPNNIKVCNTKFVEICLSFSFCLFIQQIILIKPHWSWARSIDKIGTILAKPSYTLYLTHRIIFLFLFYYIFDKKTGDMSMTSIGNYALFLTLTLIGCYLAYLMFEKHTNLIKKYLKEKLLGVDIAR